MSVSCSFVFVLYLLVPLPLLLPAPSLFSAVVLTALPRPLLPPAGQSFRQGHQRLGQLVLGGASSRVCFDQWHRQLL